MDIQFILYITRLLHAKYNIFFHSLFLERWCSRTCIKRSPLGQRKSGLLRQVNSQKRFNSYETRKNCFRYLKLMSPLNAAICTTISYTLWVEWYYLKNNYLTLWSKVPRRSLRYATHRLMVMHPHTKYHWPIWKDKNVMARTRKYYLKNNYLTKVSWRSLRYATHRLMVMHPHTKYNWPIWKDKKVMVRTSFAEKKQKKRKKKSY